jgi:cytochrome c-type biogenesis protein CcmH/NrfF
MITDRRTFLRALLVAPAAALVPAVAFAQAKMAEGMAKGSGIRIKSDQERRVFADLLCMCGGCQRESLSECICGQADDYRSEVRAMLAEGLSQEQIKAEWVRRFGPQALSVPPNEGASRLLYIAPLVGIVAMAAFVVTVLKRFRARDVAKAGAAAKAAAKAGPGAVAGGGRDEYDDKLDEELKQLDDE